MSTYTKGLKQLVINNDASIEDTADNAQASIALGQFLKGETMVYHLQAPEGLVKFEVPFHAVQIVYVEALEPVEVGKADPYCGESGTKCEDIYRSTLEFISSDGVAVAEVLNIGAFADFKCSYTLKVGDTVFTDGQAHTTQGQTVAIFFGDVEEPSAVIETFSDDMRVTIPGGEEGLFDSVLTACCSAGADSGDDGDDGGIIK